MTDRGWRMIVIGMLLGVLSWGVAIFVSGYASLPPHAPALVESVTIRPLSQSDVFLNDGLPQEHADTVEIARDQEAQADEVSPWVVWLMLGGFFVGLFLWAMRWSRSAERKL